MHIKRYFLAAIALYVFIFLYEWIVHGFLLIGMYEETANVWRSFSDMQVYQPLAICFQLALAAWTAFAFTQLCRKGGVKNGILFGLFFGVFAALLTAAWYLWLPIPSALAWSWFFSGIVEGLGGGLILGSIYHS